MVQPDGTAADAIEPGQRVFDDDGELLGVVSGYTDDGFEVEMSSGEGSDGAASAEVPGQQFGEGFLMWECTECGKMGDLEDGLPESCPNCGAPREAIAEARED